MVLLRFKRKSSNLHYSLKHFMLKRFTLQTHMVSFSPMQAIGGLGVHRSTQSQIMVSAGLFFNY